MLRILSSYLVAGCSRWPWSLREILEAVATQREASKIFVAWIELTSVQAESGDADASDCCTDSNSNLVGTQNRHKFWYLSFTHIKLYIWGSDLKSYSQCAQLWEATGSLLRSLQIVMLVCTVFDVLVQNVVLKRLDLFWNCSRLLCPPQALKHSVDTQTFLYHFWHVIVGFSVKHQLQIFLFFLWDMPSGVAIDWCPDFSQTPASLLCSW
jgi:hypothetical protein